MGFSEPHQKRNSTRQQRRSILPDLLSELHQTSQTNNHSSIKNPAAQRLLDPLERTSPSSMPGTQPNWLQPHSSRPDPDRPGEMKTGKPAATTTTRTRIHIRQPGPKKIPTQIQIRKTQPGNNQSRSRTGPRERKVCRSTQPQKLPGHDSPNRIQKM